MSEEVAVFEAMLEDLQRSHAGKYVVVHDGRVIATGDTYAEAYEYAVKHAGKPTNFMIARVPPASASESTPPPAEIAPSAAETTHGDSGPGS